MEAQHITAKIYLKDPAQRIDYHEVIRIFHRWIQADITDELAIDVADYSHVPAGPGVMLIAHEGFYAIEPGAEERVGVLYNTREAREGSNEDRIRRAVLQAVKAADLLQKDDLWKERVAFDAKTVRIAVNDRAVVANDDASLEALRPALDAALQGVFGRPFKLTRVLADPRERLTIEAVAADGASIDPREVLAAAGA